MCTVQYMSIEWRLWFRRRVTSDALAIFHICNKRNEDQPITTRGPASILHVIIQSFLKLKSVKEGEGIPDLLTLREERESGLERKKRSFVRELENLAKLVISYYIQVYCKGCCMRRKVQARIRTKVGRRS